MSTPHDPLVILGSDVFHNILLDLPPESLVIVDQVSSRWRNWVRANTNLWSKACRLNGVDLVDYREWSAQINSKQEVPGSVDELRKAVDYHLEVQDAWRSCKVRDSTVISTHPVAAQLFVADPSEVTAIALDENDEVLIFNRFSGRLLQRLNGFPDDGYIVVAAGYLIISCGERSDGSATMGPVQIWRTARATARDKVTPNETPNSDGPYSLMTSIDWLAACTVAETYLDRSKSDNPKAILCAIEPTMIHIVHLEDGMRHETIPVASLGGVEALSNLSSMSIDDDYFYVMHGKSCTIISRHTKSLLISFPDQIKHCSAWLEIPLGDYRRVTDPEATSQVHEAAMKLRVGEIQHPYSVDNPSGDDDTEVRHCFFTSRDMIFLSQDRIVYMVRDYTQVLRAITGMETELREEYVARHTMTLSIADRSSITDIALYGDNIALLPTYHATTKSGVILVNANDLPELPVGADPPQTVPAHILEFGHRMRRYPAFVSIDAGAVYFGHWGWGDVQPPAPPPPPPVAVVRRGRKRRGMVSRTLSFATHPDSYQVLVPGGGVRVWSFRP